MRRTLSALALAAVLLSMILSVTGCGGGSVTETTALAANLVEPPELLAADFVTVVDNPYFPLTPGTTLVYESRVGDELTVDNYEITHNTKVIQGVTCVEVHDVVRTNGVLIEDTLDWHAQDKFGNVWYFGEATTEFLFDDEGNPTGTSTEGSWQAGVDGATPGIIMLADPKSGLSYRQELAEEVAEDMATIMRLNARVSVPFGDFADCLVTKEWTPLAHGQVEQKYYAPGVGLVLVVEHSGKVVHVELVDVID